MELRGRDTLNMRCIRNAERKGQSMKLTPDERAELSALGVARLDTHQVFKGSQWDYLTDAALSGAELAYAARLERFATLARSKSKDDRARGRRGAKYAHRTHLAAVRALHAVDKAPTELDRDPLLAEVVKARAAEIELPAANVRLAASRDPMAAHPWSLQLEHLATQYLHAHAERGPRPDVWSRRHGSHVARPDRVAFRGVARFALPQPCRYGKCGNEPAAVTRDAVRLADMSDTPNWSTVPVTEYLTVRTGGTGRTRVAWRGHRQITLTLSDRVSVERRASRSKARKARVEAAAVGKRGPAVGPWSLSPRSLPAAVKRDAAVASLADRIEQVLRSAHQGDSFDLIGDDATVTVIDRGASEVLFRDTAWPLRDWARRAALAGLDL